MSPDCRPSRFSPASLALGRRGAGFVVHVMGMTRGPRSRVRALRHTCFREKPPRQLGTQQRRAPVAAGHDTIVSILAAHGRCGCRAIIGTSPSLVRRRHSGGRSSAGSGFVAMLVRLVAGRCQTKNDSVLPRLIRRRLPRAVGRLKLNE
jgi:hypothetical protein